MANRSTRLWQGIFAGLILLVLATGATLLSFKKRRYVWTNDASVEAYFTDIDSHILSQITGLFADEGQFVAEGTLLCTLDDSDLRAKLQSVLAEAGSAEARVQEAEIFVEKAQSNFRRALEAFEAAVTSGQEYDHRLRDWQAAVERRDEERRLHEQALARVQLWKAELAYTRIHAPISGFVAKRWRSLGDVVTNGDRVLTLADPRQLWVLAFLVETDLRRVELGSPASIQVDAFPGQRYRGRVIEIDPAAATQIAGTAPEYATWQYTWVAERIPVKISMEGPYSQGRLTWPRLLPGLSVEVTIDSADLSRPPPGVDQGRI